MTPGPTQPPLVLDTFDEPRRRGSVIGSTARRGQRLGRDRFRVMSIDADGLRIRSLPRAGWCSTSLAYEFEAATGVGFGAYVLNGHNTSQSEPLGETLDRRFKRWLKGNEVDSWARRSLTWLRSGRRLWTLRMFRHWGEIALRTRRGTLLRLDENMSVGLLRRPTSDAPLDGHSFVMHATGPFNGELWVGHEGMARRTMQSVQNIPLYLLVVLRDDDAVFLAGSVEGVGRLPTLPAVRPLAVVPRRLSGPVMGAIQQSVSGQIGFQVDTRVHHVVAADVSEWVSAIGAGSSIAGPTDVRSLDGPIGLIRARFERAPAVGLRWGDGNGQRTVRFDDRTIRVSIGGVERSSDVAFHAGRTHDLQITDDGSTLGVHLDGVLVFDDWIDAPACAASHRLEIEVERGVLTTIEVQPRHLDLPPSLRPTAIPIPAICAEPREVVDEFDGPDGALDGRPHPSGAIWRRSVGTGAIEVTPRTARVAATAERPLPGRLVHTIDAPGPLPIELEIDVLPPGSGRGTGHRGRAGVIFENERDALIVATWLDDSYAGASVSSFFRKDGFEDLYDAVWSNVGQRIMHGRPYRLKVAFDGDRYTASVDDEMVIYRNLSDVVPGWRNMAVDRVGIVANWEWGTDTGSTFRRFVVRHA